MAKAAKKKSDTLKVDMSFEELLYHAANAPIKKHDKEKKYVLNNGSKAKISRYKKLL